MRSDRDHLKDVLEHKAFVLENCIKLSDYLWEQGEHNMALRLIVNGHSHDHTKFAGIEWLFMRKDVEKTNPELVPSLKLAVQQHNHSPMNLHHPEAWGGILRMRDNLYVAEMMADWAARSMGFKTSLEDYIHDQAMGRFGFTTSDPIYDTIMRFASILCDTAFKQMTPSMGDL